MGKLRVLTFSSLFPNEAMPRHGLFVERRLRHLVDTDEIESRVVAPVPWFPSRNSAFGSYAKFAAAPREEVRGGIRVSYGKNLMKL